MDYDYWIRIAISNLQIKYLPEKLAFSRLYPETKTLSSRELIYKEIFKISKKYFGYPYKNFCIGYFHHRIHEKKGMLNKVFKFIPYSYRLIGEMYCFKGKSAFFVESLIARLKTTLKELVYDQSYLGFYNHNYLSSKSYFNLPVKSLSNSYYLVGIALVDLEAIIAIDGEQIFYSKFYANKPVKIIFYYESQSEQKKNVEIFFSNAKIIESKNKAFSVYLLATNLLPKHD
jgi:hypothetical protein